MRRRTHPAPAPHPHLPPPPSAAPREPATAPSTASPNLVTAFVLLVVLRTLSALVTPPTDCDEVFNYWEPMHYLLFGHAFQTWEYSPLYALRSYAYLLPYAAVAKLALLLYPALRRVPLILTRISPKVFAFLCVRLAQACVCAAAETALVAAANVQFGSPVAGITLALLAASPGMFRTSVEFLPSSFAMIALAAAFAAWMHRRLRVAIVLVAVAALLGWIFAAALAVPMALHILVGEGGGRIFMRTAAVAGVVVLGGMTAVDSWLYGRLVVAPLNHLLYNVFPREGAGSHLFGEEEVGFYVRNLLLNWNVAAVLVASFPVFVAVGVCGAPVWRRGRVDAWKRVVYLSPTYVWLAIFMAQPHKEERFLAPCYPFIALIAAVAFVDWVNLLDRVVTCVLRSRTPRRVVPRDQTTKSLSGSILKRMLAFLLIVLSVVLGGSRTVMQVMSFRAPLQVYAKLSNAELQDGAGPRNVSERFLQPGQEVTICVGKEWYRFPSSFFLPDRRFRVQFVRAGFTGLMPKRFAEHEHGTRAIPEGMNEFNKEDPSQFYDWESGHGCHYFIDFDLSHRNASPDDVSEDKHPIPVESRVVISSEGFLDSEISAPGFRAFLIPVPHNKSVYGQYRVTRNSNLLPAVS